MVWQILIGVVVALAAVWVLLVVFRVIVRPKGFVVNEATQLIPETLRLLKRPAADSVRCPAA